MSRPKDTEYERNQKPLTKRRQRPHADERLVVPGSTKPPPPPEFLDGEAREAWLRMAKDLHEARILVKVSRDKLIRYCVAWDRWSQAVIAEQNCVKPKRWGGDIDYLSKLDRWHKVMVETERVMQDFEKHYGLTPLAATKIRAPSNVGGKSPEEELDEFLEDEKQDQE